MVQNVEYWCRILSNISFKFIEYFSIKKKTNQLKHGCPTYDPHENENPSHIWPSYSTNLMFKHTKVNYFNVRFFCFVYLFIYFVNP